MVEKRFRGSELSQVVEEDKMQSLPSTSKNALLPKRDDDTHYFDSYGDNGAFKP